MTGLGAYQHAVHRSGNPIAVANCIRLCVGCLYGDSPRSGTPGESLADLGVRTVAVSSPQAGLFAPVTVPEIELGDPSTVTYWSAATPGENGRAQR